MTKLNVSLTQDFRLTADERNFIVERRVTVDPTRAPNWSARKAADPTLSDAPYEIWRDDGGYYSLTATGLTAAIQNVIIRQATMGTDGSAESAKLSDFFGRIAEQMRGVTAAVDRLLTPTPKAVTEEVAE